MFAKGAFDGAIFAARRQFLLVSYRHPRYTPFEATHVDLHAQFADFLETLTFQRIYAQRYQTKAKNINAFISGASTISTAGSIAGWSLWDTYPTLWACIIAVSQIVQVIKPLMPFAKRTVALTGYIHKANNFAYEVESRWNRIWSGEPITADELRSMKTKLEALENKFFSGDEIPSHKSIMLRSNAVSRQHGGFFL